MQIQRSFSSRIKFSLTPLIDMVFLLVVFFMLTTTFAQYQGVELNFGQEADQKQSGKQAFYTVLVEGSGYVRLEGTRYTLPDFRRRLRALLLKHPDQAILLQTRGNVTVQEAVNVIDQIRAAGGSNVTFLDGGE